jgi:hypothetical protein
VKKDIQATEARHFSDKRSYVAKAGQDVLYGADWDARKRELLNRSIGLCEMARLKRNHASGCSGKCEEPHHIVRRSQQRDDRLSNLVGLSHFCHISLDPRKPRFGEKLTSSSPLMVRIPTAEP